MSAATAVLRLARRDVRRARARSALVVAMIGLPVLGIGAADVLYRTFQLDKEQSATRLMGAADAVLEDTGSRRVTQLTSTGDMRVDDGTPRTGRLPAPTALLPEGTRLFPDTFDYGVLTAADRSVQVQLRAVAYDRPELRGLYTQVSGRVPARGEVVLTEALARRLAVAAGDTVVSPAERLRVVGVVRDASRSDAMTAVLAARPVAGATRVIVDAPRPLTWKDVQRANAAGWVLHARGDLPGQPPLPPEVRDRLNASTVTAGALVLGMALLEVVLLAGPAFAVGAKRQSRELAMLSASGGDRRDVRRTVLGAGLVLGTLGAVCGVAGGILVAWFAVPRVQARTYNYPGPFDVRPLELLAIAGVGVVTAVLAAVMPARAVARQDVVAALTGRRGQVRSLRRTPVLGLAAALVGTVLAMHGARNRDVNTILVGSIIAELGLVATTPFLVGLAGRLSPFLPLGPRIALRDASRNRGRTAPAVSAVLAAVAGSVAVGTYVASLDRYEELSYTRSAPLGTTTVQLGEGTGSGATKVAALLQRQVPDAKVRIVRGVVTAKDLMAQFRPAPADPCAYTGTSMEARRQAAKDPLCNGRELHPVLGGLLVGGPEDLAAVSGLTDARYAEVLAAGGAVVPAVVYDEKTASARLSLMGNDGTVRRTVILRALPMPRDALQVTLLSEAAAARAALAVAPAGVVASSPPSKAVEDRLRKAVSDAAPDARLVVERGYQSDYGWGMLALLLGSTVIVLGASGIATGLAAADGRADLATLSAVGASPSTRRSLAAFQSAVTAVLGTALGIVAGVVPAVGMVRALNSAAEQATIPRIDPYPLVLPWQNLLLTALLVPLLAAGAAALLTRSRLPMVRRVA